MHYKVEIASKGRKSNTVHHEQPNGNLKGKTGRSKWMLTIQSSFREAVIVIPRDTLVKHHFSKYSTKGPATLVSSSHNNGRMKKQQP